MAYFPTVSFAIPVLNSSKTIGACLRSIVAQDYPEEKMEIIIADGGSTDNTVAMATSFGAKVVPNALKTGEAGKAAAAAHCRGDMIALVDSDNLLEGRDWLQRMVAPFQDPDIMGTEPWAFTWRREDPPWSRYCALMGVNDPLCIYLGNFDRYNYAKDKWTMLPVEQEDKGDYLKIKLSPGALPTIGANGFLVRKEALDEKQDYLFDIDLPGKLVAKGRPYFAKVKTGIVHLYAEKMSDFTRKQRRRAEDYFFFKKSNQRSYPWKGFMTGVVKFVLSTVTVIPLLLLAAKGYRKKPDVAWWLHPLACIATLWIYGSTVLKVCLRGRAVEYKRDHWNKT